MNKYTHLKLEERERLFAWKESGISQREIAKRLGRNVSTISRELKRNTRYWKEYIPCHAQKRYERVTSRQRSNAPLKNPEIYLYVRVHLRLPYLWSPEIISGRLKKETRGRLSITPESIYQYIYSKNAKRDKLWMYLACGRKKRMKKDGRRVRNRGKVPNAVSISKRPKYIERRRQVGHWETDNMEGTKKSRSALSVSRERSSRYTKIRKMPNQTSYEKMIALDSGLNIFPNGVLRTITQDNGKENYKHQETSKRLGVSMYFCHAYTSCEKGGVERAIKDIRRFIPKKTPLTRVSKEKLDFIERWLNNKPMKCLGYMTPHEKMQKALSKLFPS